MISNGPTANVLSVALQRLAVTIYRRGVVVREGCDQCGKAASQVFEQCVIWPIYEGHKIHHAACATCLWHARGPTCSLRKS